MSEMNDTSSIVEIPLTKGFITIVDAVDGDLAQHKWQAKSYSRYAGRSAGTRKTHHVIFMHRVILSRMLERELSTHEYVDHINGDVRNNTRANLRLVTHAQNMRNQKKNKGNTTGYKGVSIRGNLTNCPYRAYIVINDKQIHLGYYATPEEAHKAYCEASVKLHGEYGRFE